MTNDITSLFADESDFVPNHGFRTVQDVLSTDMLDDYLADVYRAWRPLRPTKIFATYWYFAAMRQDIFMRRLRGECYPWSLDPVLTQHRFTNPYRASDRVSQFLIRAVQYPENTDAIFSDKDLFFRTLLFKIFNKVETWKLLESNLGEIRWETYDFESYDSVLSRAMDSKQTIFSGAYIMPSGSSTFGSPRKHRNYLRLLESMMEDSLPARLRQSPSMQSAFETLRQYPLMGDFLAFQYLIDLNYSPLLGFLESNFVVAGPGARDGIRKCFSDFGGLNEEEIIRMVEQRQENEFNRLKLDFEFLPNRLLQLIDCQNLFCEVDKYSRVVHPDAHGRSGRTRIKQKYRLSVGQPAKVVPFYPPKWGVNERLDAIVQVAKIPELTNSSSTIGKEQ